MPYFTFLSVTFSLSKCTKAFLRHYKQLTQENKTITKTLQTLQFQTSKISSARSLSEN